MTCNTISSLQDTYDIINPDLTECGINHSYNHTSQELSFHEHQKCYITQSIKMSKVLNSQIQNARFF
jgi:hypothetical protein